MQSFLGFTPETVDRATESYMECMVTDFSKTAEKDSL